MKRQTEKTEMFLRRVDEAPLRAHEFDSRWVTLSAPGSFAAEQYRTLLYRLERLRESQKMQAVALTSALPREGKTVTTVNLALAAARTRPDRKVLLLDGDLRRRQLAQVLGIRSRPGLGEYISKENTLVESVRRFRSTPLNVLTAGDLPEEAVSLLGQEAMNDVMATLKHSFDEIYVDLPPVLPFVDATLFGKACDGVVLVVRAHSTSARWVSLAMEKLSGTPLLGCVLNGAEDAYSSLFKDYFR